jgi:alkylation response protein AidB-like acyl-CoA dehydrogenase
MTAAYAQTRVQFDRPIGSFQAIKHPLVNVLIAVEQLRSLVYAAASALDAGDAEAPLLAHMAKAAASEAYPFACSRAVQFHGGYGFTEDCDAHLYLRRALASRPAFGDARELRASLAAALLDSGAELP